MVKKVPSQLICSTVLFCNYCILESVHESCICSEQCGSAVAVTQNWPQFANIACYSVSLLSVYSFI